MKILVHARYWREIFQTDKSGVQGIECNVEYESDKKDFKEAKLEVLRQMSLPDSAKVVIMNIMTSAK